MKIHLILDRSDLAAAYRNKQADYIIIPNFRHPMMEIIYRAELVKFVDNNGEEYILKDKR
jgi:hypothetical protein